ncbi:zinc ribbon domain-containing protein YjdM [Janibacter sp. G1551]|uniref:zinc ribbon domain-containing protein YjdM n=1 Tax=Janibacter sp. G1551 TaxID=3420440 RepID=UPI003D03F610
MSDTLPPCPQCGSEYTYEMDPLLVCPECAHEWSPATDADASAPADGPRVVTDANGTPLADGDSVTVLKSLKVKGFPQAIKPGTKVKNIRLVEGVDGHDIDCKVDGFGQMQLKSSVVRKA